MNQITKLFFFAGLLIFASCNDDDSSGGGPTPEPTGNISADLTVVTPTGVTETQGWTLPNVQAVFTAGQIVITAINTSTDETLVIFLPDNGEGVYNGSSGNPADGLATYLPPTDTVSWSSAFVPPGVNPLFFVQITSIDTTAKTLAGEFSIRTNATLSSEYAVFQNGVFTEVPYSTEIDGGSGDLGSGELSCDIDGDAYTSTMVIASLQTVLGVSAINISAVNANEERIALTIPSDAQAGEEYALGGFSQDLLAQYFIDFSNFFNATDGTISITSHNTSTNEIEGTFSFEAGIMFNPPEHIITNGVFSATYVE